MLVFKGHRVGYYGVGICSAWPDVSCFFLFLFGRSFRLVCQLEDIMVINLPMQVVVRVVLVVDSRRYIWLLPNGTLQFLVWEPNLIHLANHHYVLDYIPKRVTSTTEELLP